MSQIIWAVHMSRVVHMSQITMSSTYEGSTYESNYYG